MSNEPKFPSNFTLDELSELRKIKKQQNNEQAVEEEIQLVNKISRKVLEYVYNYAYPKGIDINIATLAVAKTLGILIANCNILTRDMIVGAVDACLNDAQREKQAIITGKYGKKK